MTSRLMRAAVLGLAGALLTVASVCHSAEPPLHLTIVTVPPSYEAGDLVAVSLTLANAGQEPLTLLDPAKLSTSLLLAAGVVSFDITDAQGVPVEYHGNMMDYFPGDRSRVQLTPGAALTFRMVINDPRATGYYPIAAPGAYRVSAKFFGLATPNEATPDPNDVTFHASVVSNTIIVEMVAASTIQGASRARLSIAPSDQTCQSDADCTDAQTTCNGCSCNEPVNGADKVRYVNALHAMCAGFHGPQCDYYCRTPYVRCINQRCTMSAAPAPH